MSKKIKKYIALFAYTEGEIGYSVLFPDLPGCISYGKNFDEAISNSREAIELHISNIQKDGDKVPEPRTLEEIQKNWEDWDEWVKNYTFMIVPVRFLCIHKPVKYSLYLDQNLMARVDEITDNRSRFFAIAAEAMLGK